MTPSALLLIIISAVLHASWNLLAKRAQTTGAPLVFLFAVFETILFFPLILMAIYQLSTGTLSWIAVGFMLGSGLMHTVYFWLLSEGYRVGDLSVVYPIARGTGPLLATIGAILLFAERPTLIVFSGSIVICMGVIILTGNPRALLQSTALKGIIYGLLTGLVVAIYTLWDAYAMNQATIAPLIFQGGLSFLRMLILLPYMLNRREELRKTWQLDRWYAAGIAMLSSLAYLIILFVLVYTPVSYVAPMRALSILIGVLIGTNLLKEKDKARRLIAASTIVVGIILLNIG